MKKLNSSTYHTLYQPEPIVAEIGDAKQSKFFPRVKLSKWNNEANFSIGLAGNTLGASVREIDGTITYRQGKRSARFYSLESPPIVPAKYIRVLKSGAMKPTEIAAEYELGHNVGWDVPTIRVHWADRPSIGYYGFYPASEFIDRTKLDIPEDRIAPQPTWNDPMCQDEGLKLIDVQYDEKRDNLDKLDRSMKHAVKEVIERCGIKVYTKPDKTYKGKLYFKHEGKLVKFFSTAFVGGHYYFYINLDCDYNKAYEYFLPGKNKPRHDKHADGLRAVKPDLPDSVIDEVLERYAQLYGLPLQYQGYTSEEARMMEQLVNIHEDEAWIKDGIRDDPYMLPISHKDGLEFEVVLSSKPSSNEVSLTSNVPKNVTAYYQGELSNQQKLKENISRPPDVEKSLAVYHTEKKNNEYKTGKITHIYRPMAWDANGHKVWCDFKELEGLEAGAEYDLSRGLTIVVPQDFLNSATYPVTVDPTFGYTTAGQASYFGGDIILGNPVTGASGTIDSIVAYMTGTGGEAAKAAIYNVADSSYIKGSTELTPASGTAWQTFTGFSSQAIIAANYYPVVWSHLTAGQYGSTMNYTSYDYVSQQTAKYQALTYVAGNSPTGWPTTGSFSTVSTITQFSIYVNYTSAVNIQVSDSTTVSEKLTITTPYTTATTLAIVTNDSITVTESSSVIQNTAVVRYNNGYSYRRKITIDHTKVQNTTQTNFPLLISGTYTYLKSTGNGGNVQSTSGYDIRFEDTNGNKLDYELETYTATSGVFNAWVRIASLSASVDTDIYMYYGNSAVTTSTEQNATGVWDADYQGVYHLKDGTTLSLSDSTSNAYTLTNTNTATATTGIIDGGGNFVAASTQRLSNASVQQIVAFTLSAWIKATSLPNTYNAFMGLGNTTWMIVRSTDSKLYLGLTATGGVVNYNGTGSAMTATNWNYVVMTYDSTNGLKGYINGNSDYTVAANGSAAVATILIIGRDGTSTSWNGALDEARYSGIARSADWIKTEYNNQNSPSTFYSITVEEMAISYVIDNVTISESLNLTLVNNVSDNLTISDTPSLMTDANVSVSDNSTLAETVNPLLESHVSVSDNSTVAESVAASIESATTLQISVSDNSTLAETVNPLLESHVSVSDNSTVAESVAASIESATTLQISVSDNSTLAETVNPLLESHVSVSDNSTVAESVAASIESATTLQISVSDNSTLAETVNPLLESHVSVSDNSTVAESVAASIESATTLQISVSDNSTLAETVNPLLESHVSVSDNSTVAESVAASIESATTLQISVSDNST